MQCSGFSSESDPTEPKDLSILDGHALVDMWFVWGCSGV